MVEGRRFEESIKPARHEQESDRERVVCVQKIQSADVAVPIRDLENKYGAQSCFNQMTLLFGILNKPASQHLSFVVRSIHDWLMREKLDMADLTKTTLLGNNHVVGYVTLFEYKHEVLQHWISVVIPRAKLFNKDRVCIQQALENHEACEKYMWGKEVAWQGTLLASSLDCLEFLEAGVVD